MISLALDATALRDMGRAMRRLPRALDDELERAVRRTAREVAQEAKRSHSYIDRTGYLTRSIAAQETFGQFRDDTLEGAVTATAPYASYVEEGTTRARAYQYLGTAWLLQRDETEARMQDALEEAARRAGL